MDRSLAGCGRGPVSKLYEEPKKLVSHGLARTTSEQNGRRTRTLYHITAKGRRALATWLQEPGDGPVLEFEQLLKVFFAESGTKDDTLRALSAAQCWAQARCAESLAVGERYAEGEGPFPERLPELQLASRFLTDFYLLVLDWARWASGDRRHLARRSPPSPTRSDGDRRNHSPGSGWRWRRCRSEQRRGSRMDRQPERGH